MINAWVVAMAPCVGGAPVRSEKDRMDGKRALHNGEDRAKYDKEE